MKRIQGHLLAALLISTVAGCAESPDLQTKFSNATSLLQDGKVDMAIDAFRDLLAEHPECYQALYNLALAYKRRDIRRKLARFCRNYYLVMQVIQKHMFY